MFTRRIDINLKSFADRALTVSGKDRRSAASTKNQRSSLQQSQIAVVIDKPLAI